MNINNKKFIFGLITGAILFTGFSVFAASITPVFPTTLNEFTEGEIIEEEDWNAIELTIGETSTTSTATLHGKWNDLFASSTLPTAWTTIANLSITESQISDLSHLATSITNGLIIEPDLNTDNAAVDGDILVYDSTGTNFIWQTCAEITGSADLCDGDDASGAGAGTVSTSTIPSIGNLAYWTTSGADTELLGAVATSSITYNSPFTTSGTAGYIIGGSSFTLGLDTSGAWSGTAGSLAANGANCAAGEIALGVDASGAVEGCYEPTEADISDLSHLATSITDGLIVEADLNEDGGSPVDGDFLSYDSTGGNFLWRTVAQVLSDIGAEGTLTNEAGLYSALSDVTQFWEAGDTLSSGAISSAFGNIDIGASNLDADGTVNLGGAVTISPTGTLIIPQSATCDSNANGELCHDTTDDQLILDSRVIQTKTRIWGTTVASTSPIFIEAGLLSVPVNLDGYTMTEIRCKVDGGTSKALAVEDASANSTEDITCGTTVTSDDGSIINATVTAVEEMYIDFGATTGAVDTVSISVYGTWTRE